jgi:tRNA threonylcarbamoyl adenosine modification protein YjeE
MSHSLTLFAANEVQMMRIASLMANKYSQAGSYFLGLSGPVGVGKSVFARGFVRRVMRERELEVPSPTFAIVLPYQRKSFVLNHVDLHRLTSRAELATLQLDVLWRARQAFVVEWPALMVQEFPRWPRLDILIEMAGADGETRKLSFSCTDEQNAERMRALDAAVRSAPAHD